jgi:inosine-uridine nucleoside N-ribohydrolase
MDLVVRPGKDPRMAHKVVLVADPGIDTAFAVALALNDPSLDVLALLATPGNVAADQATQNVHTIIEQLDPPRWPRLGAAPPVVYDLQATDLHGPGGLGGVSFPCVKKHTTIASDKQLVELVHDFPHQVTVVNLGPLTVLANALDRDPELPSLVERVVCLGGAWHEPGNASAVAEFHFACDPTSARRVVTCGAPVAVIPLDVTRKIIYSPSDLLELPSPESRTCQFLRQIVPFGIRATANRYGIEGFHLNDVLGIIALARPSALTTRQLHVDVETRGELTRGMSVVDARVDAEKPNVHLGIGVDISAVHDYIDETLGRAV